MKENKKITKRKERGITLIALVITIIVLLILAGVSIAMLTGENGILSQATNSKEETDKATEEEKVKMAVMGSSITNNGYSEILDEISFRKELAKQFGNEEIDIESIKDGSFVVTIEDTKRKYYVNNDKTVINDENIIEINNLDELETFRDNVNKGNTYEGKVVLLINDITLNDEWTPIGKYDSNSSNPDDTINKSFMGIFDGKFHKISNLNINSTEKAKGLFALVKGGSVKNIGIESGNISSNSVVGGIVGYAYDNAKITNCYNKATITISDRYIGGIIGYAKNNVSIENCYNSGMVTGQYCVGGISGALNNSKTLNCYNMGDITGTADKSNIVGGICSAIIENSAIINSYSIGMISSINEPQSNYTKAIVGSIDGANTSTRIENNYFLENTVNGGNYTIKGTESKNVDEMKEIYNLLGNNFKKDVNGINNGYPILFWQ